jgi:hypothetical protein
VQAGLLRRETHQPSAKQMVLRNHKFGPGAVSS